MLNIYTAKTQPATAWVDRCGEVELRGGWEPERLLRCQCCWKKRRADRCVVQCFYDGMNIWCAEGHGCKHPQTIANKRRREHMNRSRAQQARRLREKASKTQSQRADNGPGERTMTDTTNDTNKPARPLAVPLSDQLVPLIERLRKAGADYTVAWGSGELYDEAADALERLRSELAEAVTALPQAVRNERERCERWAFLEYSRGYIFSKIQSGEPAPE